MTERTYKIIEAGCDTWNAATQDWEGLTREVTLAQFRAEVEAAKAKALGAYRANVSLLQGAAP